MIEGAQQMLENAAYRASRLAKTGYTDDGKTQTETVSQLMTDELSTYGVLIDTTRVGVTATNYGSFSGASTSSGGSSGYGAAQQILVYTITYKWIIFTPMMCSAMGGACKQESINGVERNIIDLTSTIVVRNEPYGG